MKKAWAGILAVALAISIPFIGTADSAEAANYLGCKMKNRTILWKNATTHRDYYVAAVDAMNSWGNNTKVGFQRVDYGANLTVANGNFGPTNFDGVMKSATNYLPGCSSGNWTSTAFAWLNTFHTDSYSYNKRRSVFTHEVGHALGLAHNELGSCSSMAVMHPRTYDRFTKCGISTVRNDDIRGINNLY
ncbi:matrixin family metalloprotease [Leucobacter sp. cx-42]|uniref:matrixin family metalloprotease n=1 Tax=unclassified Leucobacter TaxID=2621730 RepID=UPI00165D4846|nr:MULTISPECIES: matrixin family metalloprotease [unclassified Leucobacter]MBC9953639.1 matrixin family metalloprotease [Leucobacter sp. cx-42]